MKRTRKDAIAGSLSELDEQQFPRGFETQWPRVKYEVKGNYIRIVRPDGSHYIPISPEGSGRRKYEIYRAARKCLYENLLGPLVTPLQYKKLFDALELDRRHFEFMTIKGRVRGICLVCHKELTDRQKSYCGKPCQNIAKQRRRLANGKKAVR
jgi:hypothetical protein